MFCIIVPARRGSAGCDADPRDARFVKQDAEERKAAIARRGGDETAEQPLIVGIEELQQRAGLKVCAFARPLSPRLVNICENCAETNDRCRSSASGTGYEEQSLGYIAAYRGEQALSAECAEDSFVAQDF